MVRHFAVLVATIGLFAEASLHAQAPASLYALPNKADLPTAREAWVNSPPLSEEMIQGKAVVFFCFEEGCPHVRSGWPQRAATAATFADKPLLFVAVNSGTPALEARKYVADVKLSWPVLIDEDRAFEKALLKDEISLKNINQVVVRLPDGSWAQGDWANLAGTANGALDGAEWKLDPAGIPANLKTAWRQVEFGNYTAAAAAISAGAQSSQPDEMAASKKLLELVETTLRERLATARNAANAGDKWEAYKQYEAVETTFKGYPLAAEATIATKSLAKDEKVGKELAAARQWKAILSSPKPRSANAFKLIVAQVERFVQSNAETEAGRAAQAALDRVPRQP